MFNRCLKKYLLSLKSIPGILGIFFLALLLGGTILVAGMRSSLNEMTDAIKTATGQQDLTSEEIWDAFTSDILKKLDYDENGVTPMPCDIKDVREAVKAADTTGDGLLSISEVRSIIVKSLSNAVSATVEDYADHIDEISTALSGNLSAFNRLWLIFIFIQLLAVAAGRSYAVISAGAEEVEHRNILAIACSRLFSDIMLFIGLVVIVWLTAIAPIAGIIIMALYPMIYCVTVLWCAGMALGRKRRPPMAYVLSAGNILTLWLFNAAELLIAPLLSLMVSFPAALIIGTYVNLTLATAASAAAVLGADSAVSRAMKRAAKQEAPGRHRTLDVVELDPEDSDDDADNDTY